MSATAPIDEGIWDSEEILERLMPEPFSALTQTIRPIKDGPSRSWSHIRNSTDGEEEMKEEEELQRSREEHASATIKRRPKPFVIVDEFGFKIDRRSKHSLVYR